MAEAMGVAIVGLGKIGQYLDEGLDSKLFCLSHSSAVAQHPAFKLTCGIDPDPKNRDAFAKRFSAATFANLAEAGSRARFQGLIICGPTSENFSLLKQAIELKPQWILLEKPMGTSLEQAREILRLTQAAKINLGVNFIRRAEPGVQQVRELITTGRLGKVEKILVTYSKGLFNNASHFVDLLRYWIGESSGHQVIGSLTQNFQGDPEPDFVIHFGGVPAYFVSAREDNFSVRDIEIIGSRAGLHYLRGGLKIKVLDVVESKVFRGYKFLEYDGTDIPNQLNRCQYFIMDSLSRWMTQGGDLSFSGAEALRTMEDVERIKHLCQVH